MADKKAKEPNESSAIADLSKIVGDLAGSVKTLTEEFSAFKTHVEDRLNKPNDIGVALSGTSSSIPSTAQPVQADTTNDFKDVHPEWRKVVDEVLNPAFGAAVKYHPNAHFELVIVVPKEYSNATAEYWRMYGVDRRPRMIPEALNITGVRAWVDKIAENLGRDIMFKVDLDRPKLLNANSHA